MSYEQTLLRTRRDNVLFSVLVELTYRCNLDCFFCYNDLSLSGRQMRLSDYDRFFEDLCDMQCLHVSLSGGEPLAHPEFFPIARKARSLGFVTRIKSNGHGITRTVAERIRKEVDPFIIEVSLHGATENTHDRQTRVPGSFRRLLSNLEAMRRAGLRVKLNSTLTRWNETEASAMLELADSLALPLQFDPEVTPRDDGDRTPLAIAASREGLTRLYRAQAARAASNGAGPTPPVLLRIPAIVNAESRAS